MGCVLVHQPCALSSITREVVKFADQLPCTSQTAIEWRSINIVCVIASAWRKSAMTTAMWNTVMDMNGYRKVLYEVTTYLRSRRFAGQIRKQLTDSRQCVMIYQMGRVASQTVNDTIRACLPDVPVYHVHWLNPVNIARAESRVRKHYGIIVKRHLLVSRQLRRFIDRHGLGGREWLVVTMVRDPVARNLSEFFLDLDKYYFPGVFAAPMHSEKLDTIARYFSQEFDHLCRCHWFDEELKNVLGVDVLAEPFDRNRGYQLLGRDSVQVLVLRQEDMPGVIKGGIRALTGKEPGEIVQRHVSERGPNADIYRELRERVSLSGDVLERVYACPWVRHFYSDREIEEMRKRWQKQ